MNTAFLILFLIACGIPALLAMALLIIPLSTLIFCPGTLEQIRSDLTAIRERDPAAESLVARMFYPGWWALVIHRLIAHPLYKAGLRTAARLANFWARFLTGTDIHPGARFGRGIFIDHGHGVVIGETAIVGDNVTILHQVTLGGTGKDIGKRHPTIEDGVLLSAGSKVLGNIVVGKNSKIGAGSVVVHAVPPDSTVVGVPGKVVASGGQRVPSQQLEQTSLPDPTAEKIREVQEEQRRLFEELRKVKEKMEPQKAPDQKIDIYKTGRGLASAPDVLIEIVENKRAEVAVRKAAVPLEALRARPTRRKTSRNFYAALKRPGLSLIAEVKKASPSGGLLRADFDPAAIARIYEQQHATALSVLTDEKYFQGSLEYLGTARDAVKIPILRKDFIVDEYQIVEAERYGADAILLIVACLDLSQLHDFREAAEGEGLDALVEVHDEQELETALKSGARILGINNRNLKTLETNLETTFTLLKKIPKQIRENLVVVSESGISKLEHTQRLIDAGVDAVLIGEAFMRAPNIAEKIEEIMGGNDFSI